MAFRFRRRRRVPRSPRAEIFDDSVILSREAEAESKRIRWQWLWFLVTAVIGGLYLFVSR
jgi:hypothetical protein